MPATKKLLVLGTGTLITGLVFSSSLAFAGTSAPKRSRIGFTFNSTSSGVTLTAASNTKAYLVTTTPDTRIPANRGPHTLASLKDALGVRTYRKENREAIAASSTRAVVYLPRSKL